MYRLDLRCETDSESFTEFGSVMADFGNLDCWRKLFRRADSDIFVVIEHAIVIAASDYPTEFRNRRDQIVERIFSCQLPRCFGCDRIKQREIPEETEETRNRVDCGFDERTVDEDLKWESTNYSFDEAEALTEEIEEKNQITKEVLKIKQIIMNKEQESEARLYDSLKRLQIMRLSVEVLKETGIGKSLSGLRKHRSKQIAQLASSLIE
ncbi:putative mediator of RNA polymerase II transcription subunit 26b [Wolffia australiana]